MKTQNSIPARRHGWRGIFPLTVHAVIALALLCSGCKSPSASRTISAIPSHGSDHLWVSVHVGVAESARNRKLDVHWNGPNGQNDGERQIALINTAIRDRNYGLILSPSNPFALNTAVAHALAAGMPVVAVGEQLTLGPRKNLSFVLNDEQVTGRLAAQRIELLTGGKGEVLVLGMDPLSLAGTERAARFSELLTRGQSGLSVVDAGNNTIHFGQAELAVESTLQAHRHLTAIFALNPAAAQGAIVALETTGKRGKIPIVGFGYSHDLAYLLRHRAIDAIIAPNMRRMGQIAVDNLVAQKQNQKVVPVTYVQPMLVTPENIDGQQAQELLDLDWRATQ